VKVAFFIGTLRTEGDGAARVLLTLAREAKRRGVEAVIITGHSEDSSRSPVPVVLVPSVVWPFYQAYRYPLAGRRTIRRLLDEFQPDVVHVHSPDTMSWAAAREGRRRGARVVATHHTDFIRYLAYYHLPGLEPVVWKVLQRFYSAMDVVTAPSPVTTEELRAHGLTNVETIPWGVDLEAFGPGFRSEARRRELLGDRSGAILLCVCRLTWEKDLKTLAATHALLKARRDDFAMVVAGEGPAHAEVAALMPGAVFLGNLEQGPLSELYASSEVLLFPSSTETFGSVTLEAMASGAVPVVADAEGSRALVRHGETGLLAPPGDAEAFRERVETLLDDPALRTRMRAAGLAFAQDFTWERVFDRLQGAYAPPA